MTRHELLAASSAVQSATPGLADQLAEIHELFKVEIKMARPSISPADFYNLEEFARWCLWDAVLDVPNADYAQIVAREKLKL